MMILVTLGVLILALVALGLIYMAGSTPDDK